MPPDELPDDPWDDGCDCEETADPLNYPEYRRVIAESAQTDRTEWRSRPETDRSST